MEKELKDISWLVPEDVYRADSALSYSTLSTFEKSGFDGLDHLFDKQESPSLLFGSVVDSLLTGGASEFNSRFIVRDINITESGIATCKALADMPSPYVSFDAIPERIVSEKAKSVGFWSDDKWDKGRYAKVLKTGDVADYYYSLINSDKTVISTELYSDAIACVRALREAPATSGYFADDDPFSPVKRYYQLKFKANLDGITFRSMLDIIVVDYEKKIIYPVDLKTCGISEWNFEDNFKRFFYQIQARLYWKVLRANLDRDPYFKDFSLENFRFIVINKNTLIPLVWEFPFTRAEGDFEDDRGNIYRDPITIAKELKSYLDCRPEVPNGINKDGVNLITCLKKA